MLLSPDMGLTKWVGVAEVDSLGVILMLSLAK